ncbi:MAG: rod shape-determining protein MreD [Sphingobium sp.]|jgi:rod shape-determining protein MreD|uniref:Rod shape-determining protein MreD n=1 Tax=Sphingobium xenophagum TaxID=121428 RepID=A0A249MVI1_SPHXE|nr:MULTISPECIES: rod shape-determining protein MreD [Sphingobium]MBU0774744.1 rod shape-determining protein MreD [Alphaproteobacteria bacterium]ASY45174.1 rod shape-determining protein MreD [Sphingobium xenophagum]MBA4755770.1 rod shape-determining protein MreD [Sphingobium sp.]MBG6116629.1 rod shape-determining protein MreD [Sphingobium sp. JAI105]MBS90777.1 rod shape-determining protein MreD [Sphingobium sp.]|tara:strand:+ start:1476 stop:2003 length:528 start_codon:yes stop_codon:yes gene_type:complete
MIDRHLHYVPRLGRNPSRFRLAGIPVITVMLGSSVTALPVIAQSPVMPPFGLLFLLSWRLLRPELWRAWIGLPLGLFDDMMSGQPIGSAMFLWTIMLIGVDAVEHRMIWRSYRQDWLIAGFAIIVCMAGGLFFARITGGGDVRLLLVAPQMFWTILLFPFVVRQCARIDRWRVMA